MEKEVLNLGEASELLGVSSKTLLKILREEDVPARKIGREWRFSKIALLNWVSAGSSLTYVSEEQRVNEYFNQLAPNYTLNRIQFYGPDFANLIFDRLPLEKNMWAADIGCGTGYLTKSLAERVERLTAVDASKEMLEVARKEINEKNLPDVEFINADAKDLPVPSNSFDIIFSCMLLHHISDPVEVLKEFYRTLKHGGQVAIVDFEEHHHHWLKEEKSDLWLGFNRLELLEWLKEVGFTQAMVNGLDYNCYSTGSQGKSAKIEMIIISGTKE